MSRFGWLDPDLKRGKRRSEPFPLQRLSEKRQETLVIVSAHQCARVASVISSFLF